MSLGGGEVYEASLAQEVESPAVAHKVFVDEWARFLLAVREFFKRGNVDFDVEVTAVCHQSAVFHHLDVLTSDGFHAARYGDEDIADLSGFVHAHHLMAVHSGLKRAYGVDLCHNRLRAHAASAEGNAASAPAVAGDDDILACPEDVGGAGDAVKGALARSVAVVEEVLGVGVVDGDDGDT